MAKKVKAVVRITLKGGGATPAPPVGNNLGQQGVNIMDFCKKFNALTANKKGETVPAVVTVYVDNSFDFIIKTPPVTEFILKKVGVSKGANNPGSEQIGKISWQDIEEIAKIKMAELNAVDLEGAKKVIAGSARSMGIVVVD